jgi:hypothetical protein
MTSDHSRLWICRECGNPTEHSEWLPRAFVVFRQARCDVCGKITEQRVEPLEEPHK